MRPLHEQSQYLKLCNAAILHGCFARPSMGFFMRHAEASERLKAKSQRLQPHGYPQRYSKNTFHS